MVFAAETPVLEAPAVQEAKQKVCCSMFAQRAETTTVRKKKKALSV